MTANLFATTSFRLAALGAIVLTAACQGSGGSCSSDLLPEIVVTVMDGQGNTGTINNVKIVVRDGAYGDSVSSSTHNITTFPTAFERPGTYTITVTGDGVKPFTVAGVVVTKNGCHVRETDVTATMVP